MSSLPHYAHAPGVAKHPEFALRLNSAMERVGLPAYGRQDWIAELTGATSEMALRYLRGDQLPPEQRLVGIADALGVNASWLLRGAGDMVTRGGELVEQPFRSAEPMVLRWIPERQAKSPSAFDLGAKAVPYESYRALADRYDAVCTRLLRAEAASGESALPPSASPHDPRQWADRLKQLVDQALASDQDRADDAALAAVNEGLAYLTAWKRRLS